MRARRARPPAVLMMAYSYYESDPRVMREAEAAVEAGFHVDFFALRKDNSAAEETIRGVRVIRLQQSKYRGGRRGCYAAAYFQFFVRTLLATTWLFLKRRYQVIHVNNMPDFLVFSTVVARLLGAKVILDIHDPMPNTFASKFRGRDSGFFYTLLLWQERLSAAFSHRVITVHHPVRDGVLAHHGLKPESVGVVANFADESVFRLREDYAAGSKISLVFHGTILERSGLRTLVTAMSLVRDRSRFSLTIIGEGDFSSALNDLIHSLGIGDIVCFDNRTYPLRSIPKRIANCNVGVVPLEISSITNYALPLKLMEYISLGLPVVTVRNEAISYYLDEEDCAYFDWNDPASLGSVLDRLADDPELLMRYRDRAVKLRRRFLWSVEKKKYVALLRELAGVEISPATMTA